MLFDDKSISQLSSFPVSPLTIPTFCNVPKNKVKINRYDIVVFQYPDDPSELFIKRVIGLPGDKIEIENGSVYANGKKLRDDFVKNRSYDSGTYVVPKNSYFMMGDNRPNSIDSRFWNNHFVKKDAIKAKAFLRLKFLPEVLK